MRSRVVGCAENSRVGSGKFAQTIGSCPAVTRRSAGTDCRRTASPGTVDNEPDRTPPNETIKRILELQPWYTQDNTRKMEERGLWSDTAVRGDVGARRTRL